MSCLHDSTGRFFYVQSPQTNEEMIGYLQEFLKRSKQAFPKMPIPTFRVSMRKSQDRLCGFGYVFISNSGVARLLLGLDPISGKPKMMEIDDPYWKAKSKDELEQMKINLREKIANSNGSWAAACDEDELELVNRITEKGIYPKVEVKLPPQVALAKIRCTESQLETLEGFCQFMKKKEKEVPGADGEGFYTPTFEIAHAHHANEGYSNNELISCPVPETITVAKILTEAQVYSSQGKNVKVIEKRIRKERRLLIQFSGDDAVFAYLFLGRVNIEGEELSFNFSRIL